MINALHPELYVIDIDSSLYALSAKNENRRHPLLARTTAGLKSCFKWWHNPLTQDNQLKTFTPLEWAVYLLSTPIILFSGFSLAEPAPVLVSVANGTLFTGGLAVNAILTFYKIRKCWRMREVDQEVKAIVNQIELKNKEIQEEENKIKNKYNNESRQIQNISQQSSEISEEIQNFRHKIENFQEQIQKLELEKAEIYQDAEIYL